MSRSDIDLIQDSLLKCLKNEITTEKNEIYKQCDEFFTAHANEKFYLIVSLLIKNNLFIDHSCIEISFNQIRTERSLLKEFKYLSIEKIIELFEIKFIAKYGYCWNGIPLSGLNTNICKSQNTTSGFIDINKRWSNLYVLSKGLIDIYMQSIENLQTILFEEKFEIIQHYFTTGENKNQARKYVNEIKDLYLIPIDESTYHSKFKVYTKEQIIAMFNKIKPENIKHLEVSVKPYLYFDCFNLPVLDLDKINFYKKILN